MCEITQNIRFRAFIIPRLGASVVGSTPNRDGTQTNAPLFLPLSSFEWIYVAIAT